MANRLSMADIDTIVTLHTSGHSQRQIAELLGVDRETVGKYVARATVGNQPNAPSGTAGRDQDLVPASEQNQPRATGSEGSEPASPSGMTRQGRTSSRSGPASGCEPFRAQILAKLEQDLEAVRIHQDLVADHREQAPSYYSVRRFIARLKRKTPLPFRRIETAAGEEAQVDFGSGRRSAWSTGRSAARGFFGSCCATAARRTARRCGNSPRKLPARPGKRLPVFWWRAQAAGDRQP